MCLRSAWEMWQQQRIVFFFAALWLGNVEESPGLYGWMELGDFNIVLGSRKELPSRLRSSRLQDCNEYGWAVSEAPFVICPNMEGGEGSGPSHPDGVRPLG